MADRSSNPTRRRSFVQLAPQQLDAYCDTRGLNARDQDLLVQLLLDARWKKPHTIRGFTITAYAERVGFGPSGRRTLPARLDVLQGAEAVRWSPGGARGRAGYLEVTAYDELVRGGRTAVGPGFVQLCRTSFDQLCRDRALTIDQRGLLLRLVLAADPSTAIVPGTSLTISKRLRLDRTRCRRLLDELAAVQVITADPRAVSIDVYDTLVERSDGGAESRGIGARNRAESGSTRGAKPRGVGRGIARNEARNRAESGAKPRGIMPPEQEKHPSLDVDVDTPRPTADVRKSHAGDTASEPPSEGQGKGDQRHRETLEQLVRRLPPDVARRLIEDRRDEPARRALTRDLGRLAELVGDAEAFASVASAWPPVVDHPARLARARVRQRLRDAEGNASLLDLLDTAAAEAGPAERDRLRAEALTQAETWAAVDAFPAAEARQALDALAEGDDELRAELRQRYDDVRRRTAPVDVADDPAAAGDLDGATVPDAARAALHESLTDAEMARVTGTQLPRRSSQGPQQLQQHLERLAGRQVDVDPQRAAGAVA